MAAWVSNILVSSTATASRTASTPYSCTPVRIETSCLFLGGGGVGDTEILWFESGVPFLCSSAKILALWPALRAEARRLLKSFRVIAPETAEGLDGEAPARKALVVGLLPREGGRKRGRPLGRAGVLGMAGAT
jgi:hypothetical protein